MRQGLYYIIIYSFLLNGCASFLKKKSISDMTVINSDLSYNIQYTPTKKTECSKTYLIFNYKGKKKIFTIKLPEPDSNKLFGQHSISYNNFDGENIFFLIDISGSSAQGYYLKFPLQDNKIGSPYIIYENSSGGGTRCYSKGDKIMNLCNPKFSKSCFNLHYLEKPLDSFVIEYATFDNSSNKLIISNQLIIGKQYNQHSRIEVAFPNKILSYIPEKDFAILSLAKNSADTLSSYFSRHSDFNWYLDSTTNVHTEQTNNITKRLQPNILNYVP